MYQTLTLMISGSEVKIPAKAEASLNIGEPTAQIKNLADNKMISYSVE